MYIKQKQNNTTRTLKNKSHTRNKVDYNTHQYKLMGLVWGEKCIQLCCRLLQQSSTQKMVYQIHQTIDNESRLSLFIDQQSDECDIKDTGHYHDLSY